MALLNKTRFVGALLAALAWTYAAGADAPMLEYQVKASYLYNFTRFITWPNDAFARDGTFNICVVGAERFGATLDALAGDRVDGHAITVRRLEQAAQGRGARCHILFVPAGRDPATPPGRAERGLLTVGETPGFLERGGVINLVEINGRIRFEISQAAAQQAGLVVSSQLLSLASGQR